MTDLKDYIAEKLASEITDVIYEHISDLVKVKNLHHDTDENSRYIRQWELDKQRKAIKCANLGCKNKTKNPALVGAHVFKVDDNDDRWYICPLCHQCNDDENDDIMVVHESDLALYKEIKEIKI